jgi:hypothetical protein
MTPWVTAVGRSDKKRMAPVLCPCAAVRAMMRSS